MITASQKTNYTQSRTASDMITASQKTNYTQSRTASDMITTGYKNSTLSYNKTSTTSHTGSSAVGYTNSVFGYTAERSVSSVTEIVVRMGLGLRVPQVVGAYVMGFVSTSSAVNGPKTVGVLMVINGQCGQTRELDFYENPFMTEMVAIGNVGFMAIICLFLIIIGYLRKRPQGAEWDEVLRSHKVYIFLFTFWVYFTPGIITAFFKYNKNWYEVLSCVIGSAFILVGIYAMVWGALDIYVLRKVHKPPYHSETVIWFGLTYMCTIVEGYTKRKALFIDIFIMFLTSFTTMLDNCEFLGIITVIVNSLYIIFCLYAKGIQPLADLHGNVIISLGQSICIFLAILQVDTTTIIIILYVTSVLGSILIFYPLTQELREYCEEDDTEPMLIIKESSDTSSLDHILMI
jgi:hypothetical protein